jgi:hypothetical protein
MKRRARGSPTAWRVAVVAAVAVGPAATAKEKENEAGKETGEERGREMLDCMPGAQNLSLISLSYPHSHLSSISLSLSLSLS